MALNPYALSMLIAAVIVGAVAWYAWQRRSLPGGPAFALMMMALTLWSLAYGLELASLELGLMRLWLYVQYLGIVTAPPLWLIFTLRFSRTDRWLGPVQLALLFVIPSLTFLMQLTNERLHWLYYATIQVDASGPFPLVAITPGPWYTVHILYSYLCMLAGALVLARLWYQTPRLYRGQVSLLLLAACLPLLANLAYLAGVRPLDHIDLSPLTFNLTGLLVAFAIFRFGLFELSPIARNLLFEELRDPVLVVDQGGRLVDLNGAARHTLALDEDWLQYGPASLTLAAWPPLAALSSKPGDASAEVRLLTDPLRCFDAVSAPVRDQRGRAAGCIIVLRDITARKRAEAERIELERQMLHAQKLESLGVLAGGIAHDFNNLLMAIHGNLELARFDLPADGTAYEAVYHADQATRRAANLTRQLLAYAGKSDFVLGPVDLAALINEMTQLLQVSVGRLINFELDLDPTLTPIHGDATQIQQVVMNLITNAAEAIGANPGTITLRTRRCRCTTQDLAHSRLDLRPPPGEFAVLTVADTGAGMDQATLDRLFEPFFSTKSLGRGLGMAAVLGIVRSHAGAITVESTPGQGTTISLLFPIPVVAV
ncbi:MAG: histidine kinase N-terminal 7TM domain-containing protein [Oscillochloridaceae bacterium umkhey_bin13]